MSAEQLGTKYGRAQGTWRRKQNKAAAKLKGKLRRGALASVKAAWKYAPPNVAYRAGKKYARFAKATRKARRKAIRGK